jgi:tol-pal system protein YbgF
MTRGITFSLVAAFVFVASVPLGAQSRQEQQMAAELRQLQEQQQLISLSIAQLAEAIKALHPRFDEQIDLTRKALADMGLTIKNMANDLSVVRAQSQDTGTRLGSLSDEIEALRRAVESLPALISQMSQQLPVAPADPNAPPGTPAVSQGPPPVAPVITPPLSSAAGLSPTRLLGTAKGDYFSGDYPTAISGFNDVIKNFPGTQAAAEAQYYIGETHYNSLKDAEAIAAYTLVIQNYPKSTFVPEAYYKRGLAQDRSGQPDAAKMSFEFAVKNYPDTPGGQLAKQGLDRLNLKSRSGAQ